jgi:hypothetical protein
MELYLLIGLVVVLIATPFAWSDFGWDIRYDDMQETVGNTLLTFLLWVCFIPFWPIIVLGVILWLIGKAYYRISVRGWEKHFD